MTMYMYAWSCILGFFMNPLTSETKVLTVVKEPENPTLTARSVAINQNPFAFVTYSADINAIERTLPNTFAASVPAGNQDQDPGNEPLYTDRYHLSKAPAGAQRVAYIMVR